MKMILYKEYLPDRRKREFDADDRVDYNIKHRFVYPYISGYYRGKWTHNPKEIDELPEEDGKKFCEELGQMNLDLVIKNGRETVGKWVE